jgi:hypothetical protein
VAHTHAGNAGDFLKHVVLAECLEGVAERFAGVRYLDGYSGQGVYFKPLNVHEPTGHPKLTTFRRIQPALPNWYVGSPLVAAAALADHSDAELVLSDRDGDAVVSLAGGLSADSLVEQGTPELARWRSATRTTLAIREFVPAAIELRGEPSSVNVVLLDPTYSESYDRILTDTARTCRDFHGTTLLIAWGLSGWRIGDALATGGGGVPVGLRYEDDTRSYEVALAIYGLERETLGEVVRAVSVGWSGTT